MGKFLNGLLVGVGVGLIVAPMKGDEMRHVLGDRLEKVKVSLPASVQSSLSRQPASGKASISDVEDYYKAPTSVSSATNAPRPGSTTPNITSTANVAGDITRTGSSVTENTRLGTQGGDSMRMGEALTDTPRSGTQASDPRRTGTPPPTEPLRGSNPVADVARQAGADVRQAGQNLADNAKQATKQERRGSDTNPRNA